MGRNHKNRIVSDIDPIYEKKDWRQKTFRMAAYARVSTDSSDQENSLKNQRQHYDTMIPANPNWEYMGLYADDGISGTSIRNRTAFNQMVKDCQAGKIDLILVKEVSRFARNIVDCLNTVELLLTLDPPVGIFFENNNLNTLDTGNKIFLALFAMFAEVESELKSKSVRYGNVECFEAGDYFCPVNLLGLKKDGKYGITIEPEGAKTVRLIYDLFLAGYSKKEIAEIMTCLARPTAAKHLIWSERSVFGILSNEKYSGDFLMQKTFIDSFLTHKAVRNKGQRKIYYEPDHHDGIVSREEHARSLLLLKCNPASSFFDHKYVIKVIRKGLLSGFIPVNAAFGGYDASHYLCALETARIPQPHIEAEVVHVAGTKRVRRELFSDRYAAAMTISPHGLQFNSACRALMKETAHVEMLLHPTERLIAVRKSTARNRNAVPWADSSIPARKFLRAIYLLLGWQKGWRYKVAANCFSKNDERVILFDLASCEFQHMMLCRRALAEKLEDWAISAPASPVEGFSLDNYTADTESDRKTDRGNEVCQ